MLVLRPTLHKLIAANNSRTLKQLKALGIAAPQAATAAHTAVALSLAAGANPSQRLLGQALLDYVLRLDPLVSEVQLEGFAEDDLHELRERVPFDTTSDSGPPNFAVSIGHASGADLTVDASGWLVHLSGTIDQAESAIVNPIGPLACAGLAAGEVFKSLFRLNYPDAPYSSRFVGASGLFSFCDYQFAGRNPPLDPIALDTFLIGLGGVGAGVIRVLGELGGNVRGVLRLVDADKLSTDNLNRLTYARWRSAVEERAKVNEAEDYLKARLPNLVLTSHALQFGTFKRTLAARRQDRSYHTVVTGLDNDEVRHEVQRELPRVLIDAATGRDANITVERVVIGQWGCLGCTRQANNGAKPGEIQERCDDFPDEHAPSVSFVSGFAGTLAAAELLKEATGSDASLRGSFDHIFIYGLNPDTRSEPAPARNCRINCSNPSVLRAYRTKYGS